MLTLLRSTLTRALVPADLHASLCLRLGALVLVTVAVFLSMAVGASAAASVPLSPVKGQAAACSEDESCWNWATMGNRKRGVVTRHGNPLVVGPCRFARLLVQGRLDYRASDAMRGDLTAFGRYVRGGC